MAKDRLEEYLGKPQIGSETIAFASFLPGGYDNLDLMKKLISGAYQLNPDTNLTVLVLNLQPREKVNVFHVLLEISYIGWGFFPHCFAEGYGGEGPTAFARFEMFCDEMRERGMEIKEKRLEVEFSELRKYLPHMRQ